MDTGFLVGFLAVVNYRRGGVYVKSDVRIKWLCCQCALHRKWICAVYKSISVLGAERAKHGSRTGSHA